MDPSKIDLAAAARAAVARLKERDGGTGDSSAYTAAAARLAALQEAAPSQRPAALIARLDLSTLCCRGESRGAARLLLGCSSAGARSGSAARPALPSPAGPGSASAVRCATARVADAGRLPSDGGREPPADGGREPPARRWPAAEHASARLCGGGVPRPAARARKAAPDGAERPVRAEPDRCGARRRQPEEARARGVRGGGLRQRGGAARQGQGEGRRRRRRHHDAHQRGGDRRRAAAAPRAGALAHHRGAHPSRAPRAVKRACSGGGGGGGWWWEGRRPGGLPLGAQGDAGQGAGRRCGGGGGHRGGGCGARPRVAAAQARLEQASHLGARGGPAAHRARGGLLDHGGGGRAGGPGRRGGERLAGRAHRKRAPAGGEPQLLAARHHAVGPRLSGELCRDASSL